MTLSPERNLNNVNALFIDAKTKQESLYTIKHQGEILATGEPVFIKQTKTAEKDCVDYLTREYNYLNQFSHYCLQSALAFIHQDDVYYLITPYCPSSLDKIFQESPTTNNIFYGNSSKYLILFGIASALKLLHSKQVFFYNLCPSNILLDDNFNPVLINFGFPKSKTSSIYQAPEFILSKVYNAKSDVYSFGLILNELFSSEHPFQNMKQDQILENKKKPFQISQKVPSFLQQIARRCVSINSEERPTFDEIYQYLLNNLYQVKNSALVNNLYERIQQSERATTFFRIPRQLVIFPPEGTSIDFKVDNPIDTDLFNSCFSGLNPEQPIVLIMMVGHYGTGKTAFLKTLTGNRAFRIGMGSKPTTKGILMDGPYSIAELGNIIYEPTIQDRILQFERLGNPLFYFIDSSGIGTREYEANRLFFQRIHSAFLSVSKLYVSLCDVNTDYSELRKLLLNIRKSDHLQYSSNLILLVKGYDRMKFIDSLNFESFESLHAEFTQIFTDRYSNEFEYYVPKKIVCIPIGDINANYDVYQHSVWYIFYHFLKLVGNAYLPSVSTITKELKMHSFMLFSTYFQDCYDQITNNVMKASTKALNKFEKFSPFQREEKYILAVCFSACSFICVLIGTILKWDEINNPPNKSKAKSGEKPIKPPEEDVYNNCKILFDYVIEIVLPFFFGNLDIDMKNYNQYKYEIAKNANEFLIKLFPNWTIYQTSKIENDNFAKALPTSCQDDIQSMIDKKKKVSNRFTSATAPFALLPLLGIIVTPICIGVNAKINSDISKLDIVKDTLKNRNFSFFPFIWQNCESQFIIPKPFNLDKIKKLARTKDLLFVYYEQGDNDSRYLLSALTGLYSDYDTRFKLNNTPNNTTNNADSESDEKNENSNKIAITSEPNLFNMIFDCYFLNESSNEHDSDYSAEYKKFNFIYLKGYGQDVINQFCQLKNENIVFITATTYREPVFTIPKKGNDFYVFYASPHCFPYDIVDKKNYIQALNNNEEYKSEIDLPYGVVLPLESKNFDFMVSGPRCNELIRYGCRYIYKDKSFRNSLEETNPIGTPILAGQH